MWSGHLIVGLIISVPFGFDFKTILLCMLFSWLPNFDIILVKLGWFRKDFHGGPTHSFIFSIVVGLLVGVFSLEYDLIVFSCYLLHCICDLPTDSGTRLFYPFKKRKVTINLWKGTGFWGRESIIGYYKQKWAKILELLLVAVFISLLIIKFVY